MAGATQISQNRYIQSGNEAGNFNYQGLPPEEAVAQRALARKQQIANLLMTQGLEQAGQNTGQMQGRFYVAPSWAQGAAGLGQILAGALASHHLDQQGEELQSKQGELRAQALQDYIHKTNAQQIPEHALPQGSPAVEASPGNLTDVIGDAHPAMGTPQMRQAPTGMADRLFPSTPAAASPVDYQPPTEAQAAMPATEGPVNPAMTIQPNPMVAKVAQAQLATSTDPYLRQYAMAEAQRQAQAAEHDMNREFLGAQNTENRQNRLDVAQQGFGKDMVLATMMGANKEQLAQMQRAHELSLEAVRGANRKDVAQIGADSRVDTAGIAADAKVETAGMKGQSAEKQAQMEKGKENLQLLTGQLRDYYNQLNEAGGITSTAKGPVENALSTLQTSTAGQAGGSIFGTKNQSIRDSIAQQRPLLMQAIMKANNMTAKSMDSNVELKLWLATATDPKLGFEANKRALDMLEKLYGGEPSAGEPVPAPTPSTGPTTITSETEFNALPSGSLFIGPDGKTRKKP